jgi:ubiquinone/menaquinone biosynthesis C-methylase UbiE
MAEKGHGSFDKFRRNWETREERFYTHWTHGKPRNQIQLAFQQHWRVFTAILSDAWPGRHWKGLRALEVGCGRGTISMFFCEAGFRCTLLDKVHTIVETARDIFEAYDMGANFITGDSLALPFHDGSFDAIFSIGLLEHFEDVKPLLMEQVRMLDRRGVFIGYVVPDNPDNVQKDYDWINDVLRIYLRYEPTSSFPPKEPVFRSNYPAATYVTVLEELGLQNVHSTGVYPLPMISPSIEFPFTLNPAHAEEVLVCHFQKVLKEREGETGQCGWLCEERYGQAFLVWGQKSS